MSQQPVKQQPTPDASTSSLKRSRPDDDEAHEQAQMQAAQLAGLTAPSRKHVTRACDPCRDKRSRCDGKRPCAMCQSRNKECTYSAHRDRRAGMKPEDAKALEEHNKNLETIKSLLERKLAEVTRERDQLNLVVSRDPQLAFQAKQAVANPLTISTNFSRDPSNSPDPGPHSPSDVSSQQSGDPQWPESPSVVSEAYSDDYASDFGTSRVRAVRLHEDEEELAVSSYSPASFSGSGRASPIPGDGPTDLEQQLSMLILDESKVDSITGTTVPIGPGGSLDSFNWQRFLPEAVRREMTREDHDMLLREYFSASAGYLAVLEYRFRADMNRVLTTSQSAIKASLFNGSLYTPALHCAILAAALNLKPMNEVQKQWMASLRQYASDYSRLYADQNVGVMSNALSMAVLAQLRAAEINGVRQAYLLVTQALTIVRATGLHLQSNEAVNHWCYGSLFAQHVDIALHAGLEVLPFPPTNLAAAMKLSNQLYGENPQDLLTFALYVQLMAIVARMSTQFALHDPPTLSTIESLQCDLLTWRVEVPESHKSDSANRNILLLHLAFQWANIMLIRPIYMSLTCKPDFKKLFDDAAKEYMTLLDRFCGTHASDRAPTSLAHMTWSAGMASLIGIVSLSPAQNQRRNTLVLQLELAIRTLREFGRTKPCALSYAQMLENKLGEIQPRRSTTIDVPTATHVPAHHMPPHHAMSLESGGIPNAWVPMFAGVPTQYQHQQHQYQQQQHQQHQQHQFQNQPQPQLQPHPQPQPQNHAANNQFGARSIGMSPSPVGWQTQSDYQSSNWSYEVTSPTSPPPQQNWASGGPFGGGMPGAQGMYGVQSGMGGMPSNPLAATPSLNQMGPGQFNAIGGGGFGYNNNSPSPPMPNSMPGGQYGQMMHGSSSPFGSSSTPPLTDPVGHHGASYGSPPYPVNNNASSGPSGPYSEISMYAAQIQAQMGTGMGQSPATMGANDLAAAMIPGSSQWGSAPGGYGAHNVTGNESLFLSGNSSATVAPQALNLTVTGPDGSKQTRTSGDHHA